MNVCEFVQLIEDDEYMNMPTGMPNVKEGERERGLKNKNKKIQSSSSAAAVAAAATVACNAAIVDYMLLYCWCPIHRYAIYTLL